MTGRVVLEVLRTRRLVRSYDENGALLRVAIEPQSVGPASPLPKAETPKPQPKRPPQPAPPTAPPAAAPAPQPTLSIITEPYVEPAPRRLEVLAPRAPRVAIAPLAAPMAEAPVAQASVVERALEAAAWQDAPRAPPAAPKRFEIVAVERVLPKPQPKPEPQPEAALEPEPVRVEVKGPEPEPAQAIDVVVERAPEPVVLRERVPDVDERVDALLRANANAPRKRRRAALETPRFAPLAREAWEERLDALLAGR